MLSPEFESLEILPAGKGTDMVLIEQIKDWGLLKNLIIIQPKSPEAGLEFLANSLKQLGDKLKNPQNQQMQTWKDIFFEWKEEHDWEFLTIHNRIVQEKEDFEEIWFNYYRRENRRKEIETGKIEYIIESNKTFLPLVFFVSEDYLADDIEAHIYDYVKRFKYCTNKLIIEYDFHNYMRSNIEEAFQNDKINFDKLILYFRVRVNVFSQDFMYPIEYSFFERMSSKALDHFFIDFVKAKLHEIIHNTPEDYVFLEREKLSF